MWRLFVFGHLNFTFMHNGSQFKPLNKHEKVKISVASST